MNRIERSKWMRRIIRRAYRRGIPTKAIAAALGTTTNSVKVLASRIGVVHPRAGKGPPRRHDIYGRPLPYPHS